MGVLIVWTRRADKGIVTSVVSSAQDWTLEDVADFKGRFFLTFLMSTVTIRIPPLALFPRVVQRSINGSNLRRYRLTAMSFKTLSRSIVHTSARTRSSSQRRRAPMTRRMNSPNFVVIHKRPSTRCFLTSMMLWKIPMLLGTAVELTVYHANPKERGQKTKRSLNRRRQRHGMGSGLDLTATSQCQWVLVMTRQKGSLWRLTRTSGRLFLVRRTKTMLLNLNSLSSRRMTKMRA